MLCGICSFFVVWFALSFESLCMQPAALPSGWRYERRGVSFSDIGMPVVDEAGGVGHACKIALTVEDRNGAYHSYVCPYNFIAKAPTKMDRVLQVGIPCLHSTLGQNTPLWHSEISALQHITGAVDPAVDGIKTGSILDTVLKYHNWKSFVLWIRNAKWHPCVLKTTKGVDCQTYLLNFAGKFGNRCSIQVRAEEMKDLWILHFGSNHFEKRKF